MFGSIYVGLSGLNAYSRGLQQISNNVTNLNASGFKGSTVSFNDLVGVNGDGGLSYSGGGASGGHGVEIGETRIDFKQGELRQTDRDLDLAIDGSGFMMLLRGEEVLYTRTGSFEVDKDGFIVLAGTEYRLATLDGSGRPVSLSIDASRTSTPTPTTTIKFADNLSSTATTYGISDVKVYDSSGVEHIWQIKFDKPAAGVNEWSVSVTDDKGKTFDAQTLKFIQEKVDPATNKLVFADSASGLSVTLDFSANVSSFSGGTVSTLRRSSVDGYKIGSITAIGINTSGKLEIGYSNEQKKELGAVAIADFRDPQALEQRSGGLFHDTGQAQREIVGSDDKRVGKVLSRRLEASNVDLAKAVRRADPYPARLSGQLADHQRLERHDPAALRHPRSGLTSPQVWMPDACLRHERAIQPIAAVLAGWESKWFGRTIWNAAGPWSPEARSSGSWTTLRDEARIAIRGGPDSILRMAFAMLNEPAHPNLSARDLRLLRRLSNEALEDLLASVETTLPARKSPAPGQDCWTLEITLDGEPILEISINRADLSFLARRGFTPVQTTKALAPVPSAVANVSVSVAAQLGRTSLDIDQIQSLEPGDILLLDQPVEEPITLIVAGLETALRGTIREGSGIMEFVMCEPSEIN